MPDFKTRLKRLRKQRELTQQQVGDYIGVSKVAVSGYENGIRNPEIETLKKLADLFDISIDYLVGNTDIPNKACDEANSNFAHLISDKGLLEGKHILFIDDEVVSEALLLESFDFIRAKRIMERLTAVKGSKENRYSEKL